MRNEFVKSCELKTLPHHGSDTGSCGRGKGLLWVRRSVECAYPVRNRQRRNVPWRFFRPARLDVVLQEVDCFLSRMPQRRTYFNKFLDSRYSHWLAEPATTGSAFLCSPARLSALLRCSGPGRRHPDPRPPAQATDSDRTLRNVLRRLGYDKRSISVETVPSRITSFERQ